MNEKNRDFFSKDSYTKAFPIRVSWLGRVTDASVECVLGDEPTCRSNEPNLDRVRTWTNPTRGVPKSDLQINKKKSLLAINRYRLTSDVINRWNSHKYAEKQKESATNDILKVWELCYVDRYSVLRTFDFTLLCRLLPIQFTWTI